MPVATLLRPVGAPPAVRLEHSERQDIIDSVRVPPGAIELQPRPNDAVVAALNLAARGAPTLLALAGVRNGVGVVLEVVRGHAQVVIA